MVERQNQKESEAGHSQIDELKRKYDEALKEMEVVRLQGACWRKAIYRIVDPIIIIDVNKNSTEGQIIDVSATSCEFLGFEKDDLLNSSIFDVENNLEPNMFQARYRTLKEGSEKTVFNSDFKRKDGELIPVEVSMTRVECDTREALLMMLRDISQQKLTEAGLIENEARFRSILEATGFGYFEVDLFGNFTFMNRYAVQVIRKPEEEILSLNYTALLDEENAKKVFTSFNRVFVENLSHEEIEYRMHYDDSEFVDIRGYAAPIKNSQNEIVGFRGITRDSTKELEAEEKLKELHRLNIDMAHAAGMAEMASDTLHNVGNVLNSIKVSAESVQQSFMTEPYLLEGLVKATELLQANLENLEDFVANDMNSVKLFEYMVIFSDSLVDEKKNILENIDRLLNGVKLVENVIAAQQTYATLGTVVDYYELSDIVDDSLVIKQDTLHRYAVQIEKHYKPVSQVLVQKSKLVHILLNLITNAADAMQDVPKNQRRLKMSIEQDEKKVFLKVEDNGKGIAEEERQKIFTHGYTTKKDGHGFGLHSSANYMSEMNGKIWVDVKKDKPGATFVLEFDLNATKQ